MRGGSLNKSRKFVRNLKLKQLKRIMIKTMLSSLEVERR